MPKMETRRGSAKRFKLTGTGKIKRNKANHRHMLIRRAKTVKRKMRHGGLIDQSDVKKVRRMLVV